MVSIRLATVILSRLLQGLLREPVFAPSIARIKVFSILAIVSFAASFLLLFIGIVLL